MTLLIILYLTCFNWISLSLKNSCVQGYLFQVIEYIKFFPKLYNAFFKSKFINLFEHGMDNKFSETIRRIVERKEIVRKIIWICTKISYFCVFIFATKFINK